MGLGRVRSLGFGQCGVWDLEASMSRGKESDASETLEPMHACILGKLFVSVMDMHTSCLCTGHE